MIKFLIRWTLKLQLMYVEVRASYRIKLAESLDVKIIEYEERIDDLEEQIDDAIILSETLKRQITLTY